MIKPGILRKKIAKIGIICNLFFSTPANYAGFRLSFFELVWGNTNITTMKNFFVTLGVLLVVVFFLILMTYIVKMKIEDNGAI